MFKKAKKLAITSSLISGLVIATSIGTAEAATGSWTSVPSSGTGCQVQVWTDATSYGSGASTVDAYAKTNGKCNRTFYYKMSMRTGGGDYASSQTFTGSFSSQSPTKSFDISKINTSEGNFVEVQLYSDSARTKYLTAVDSDDLSIN
ncbi:hypothetical protein [Priestia abyssalis]|uniref:hypothetical protein n=1 Tax=Priestia abyssalis TaxID=1221450 RepID=UPI0009957A2F|nr:hypothetical protein [Priestia abyssalis]